MTMSKAKEKNTGEKIGEINYEIRTLENLLLILTEGEAAKTRGAGEVIRSTFEAQTRKYILDLQDRKAATIAADPAPEKIICPHCQYDGEFGIDDPSHDGFRTLQPILEPRLVLSYDGSKLSMSDPDESYDPFYLIAEPSYHEFMDSPEGHDGSSPDYTEIRKALRGKWLFCCGKCFEYFSAKDFLGKVNLEYPGTAPWDSKWRKK